MVHKTDFHTLMLLGRLRQSIALTRTLLHSRPVEFSV